ncbi:MAG: 4Fe-4S binding protein [Deltaproteobacteria bacterium]|nr:4Fe-4S binding protein [Deltaproteobacteria bacterium]
MLNIVQDRCQPLRYGKAECRLCVEACPIDGCLSFENTSIDVKKELCSGCGICTTVCPTGALTLEGLDDAVLLGRLSDGLEKKNLFIGCHLGPGTENRDLPDPFSSESNFVNIPCLAVLKESHLAALILSGVGRIGLDCSRCSSCAFRGAKGVIEKTARYAENLLARAGLAGRIEILETTEVLPAGSKGGFGLFRKDKMKGVRKITHGPEYSRRELFSFLKSKAEALAAERALGRHTEKEKLLENCAVPQRRSILLEALKAADARELGPIKDGEFPIRQIGIGEKCVMCRRCDAFCPTGALKRVQTEGEVSIEFRTALCMGCHQCMEFCPAGAIFYEEEIDLGSLYSDEAKVIMRKQVVNCPGCSKPFIPEIEKDGCPECWKKKRLEDNILSIIFSNPNKGKQTGKEAI